MNEAGSQLTAAIRQKEVFADYFEKVTGMSVQDSITLYEAQTGDSLTVNEVEKMFMDPDYAREQLMANENLHKVYRGILNSNVPQTMPGASSNFVRLPWYKSIFHNPWYAPWQNSKWVGRNGGHLEAVYNRQGNLVSSNDYMGTFNFFGPDQIRAHKAADVDPYFKWGN
ncbi:hypothetical protein CWE08_12130 [Aliidiomarina iranensis]|uniref:Uncharacterized protein n=1 Tax=Aliidiomarina iranensis TaxID=1434071 RepID=A0A432VPF4_9GAMM|nr:hypothetical protein [Aliidiomarina iranensis]RUO17976.1 hypothetical protein CWE08_12130 [Aliidiomarina iranensis]